MERSGNHQGLPQVRASSDDRIEATGVGVDD